MYLYKEGLDDMNRNTEKEFVKFSARCKKRSEKNHTLYRAKYECCLHGDGRACSYANCSMFDERYGVRPIWD